MLDWGALQNLSDQNMNVDENKDGGEVLCKEATRLIPPRPAALTWGQDNAAAPITWTIWRIGGKRGEVTWSH